MTYYYHGGAPGLKVGQKILPASKTNNAFSIEKWKSYEEKRKETDPDLSTYNRERIYLTTNHQWALFFAAAYNDGLGGAVYQVIPDGDIENDPDYRDAGDGHKSLMAESGTIVRVTVMLSKSSAKRMLGTMASAMGGK